MKVETSAELDELRPTLGKQILIGSRIGGAPRPAWRRAGSGRRRSSRGQILAGRRSVAHIQWWPIKRANVAGAAAAANSSAAFAAANSNENQLGP